MRKLPSKRSASLQQKVRVIKEVLTGHIDLSSYASPRCYNVIQEEKDVYQVKDIQSKNVQETTMNHEEFMQWRSTLREKDVLFMITCYDYTDDELINDK